MDNHFHAFDSADHDHFLLALYAARKAKMNFSYDYRTTCEKHYHYEITANTPDQVAVLDLIILADSEHEEQPIYKQKLFDYVYGRSE